MQDVSGFGSTVRVVASNTFPAGFTVSQFADDTDPFDIPNLVIADSAMGVNGDLVVWTTANPITMTLAVIPDSEDDRNLAVLLEANRAGRGKNPARDEITLSAIYPDGRAIVLSPGKITAGLPGNSVASAGRFKSKPYTFVFEQMSRT